MVRFRVETIPCGGNLHVLEEKSFLNSVVQHFRNIRADVIIPASNNAIFRTYPDGADAAPYGSYVIDLRQPEDVLWKNIGRKTRQNINTAQKSGIAIREGMESLKVAYDLIRETFRRSEIPFMERAAFERFVRGLGEQSELLTAEHQGVVQSYCLFAFSIPCAYAIYAGNIQHQQQGANKLLYWEAIRLFRSLGMRKFDFYGARINPEKGSKQEGINLLKMLMGATLSEGYMWKYSLRPWRASVYSIGVRVLRGGDIVDQEAHKLQDYTPKLEADAARYPRGLS
jgi:lipid II:glycine glycyltransferase (peptidoglycan interpeptide bridge formation enzyme)